MNASSTPALPASAATHGHADVAARLQQSEIFREYREAFQTATGLPLVLRPVGAGESSMAGTRNINAFCALMAVRRQTCAACVQMHARIEAEAGPAGGAR